MADHKSNERKEDDTVNQYQGRAHRVSRTYDKKGKLIEEIFSPLLIEFRFSDVLEIIVGASVLAIPIAYTEEVWKLGEQLPWGNIVAVFITSIVVVSSFVYFIYYKDHFRGHGRQFLLRVFACYGITLLVVAIILTMFQKFPLQSDSALAIRRMILVGFPACFSATVLDSLQKE